MLPASESLLSCEPRLEMYVKCDLYVRRSPVVVKTCSNSFKHYHEDPQDNHNDAVSDTAHPLSSTTPPHSHQQNIPSMTRTYAQRKIAKARPHPEIFPISALRIPSHCSHELWTSRPAFTLLHLGRIRLQTNYRRSSEKLITSRTAIFAKLALHIAQPTKT